MSNPYYFNPLTQKYENGSGESVNAEFTIGNLHDGSSPQGFYSRDVEVTNEPKLTTSPVDTTIGITQRFSGSSGASEELVSVTGKSEKERFDDYMKAVLPAIVSKYEARRIANNEKFIANQTIVEKAADIAIAAMKLVDKEFE